MLAERPGFLVNAEEPPTGGSSDSSEVEVRGLEPLTSTLPASRSPN